MKTETITSLRHRLDSAMAELANTQIERDKAVASVSNLVLNQTELREMLTAINDLNGRLSASVEEAQIVSKAEREEKKRVVEIAKARKATITMLKKQLHDAMIEIARQGGYIARRQDEDYAKAPMVEIEPPRMGKLPVEERFRSAVFPEQPSIMERTAGGYGYEKPGQHFLDL